MTTFIYRPALKTDSRTIAGLYSVSSDGLADYQWKDMARPGEDLIDVGQRCFERENATLSYENCALVLNASGVLGALVAYPSVQEAAYEIPKDPVLRPFYELSLTPSYCIAAVVVHEAFRRQGIGSSLMLLAEEKAQRKAFTHLSLLVFEQNQAALQLCQKLGYREHDRRKSNPHSFLKRRGNLLLLVKKLSKH